jgi:hypothetical protein
MVSRITSGLIGEFPRDACAGESQPEHRHIAAMVTSLTHIAVISPRGRRTLTPPFHGV